MDPSDYIDDVSYYLAYNSRVANSLNLLKYIHILISVEKYQLSVTFYHTKLMESFENKVVNNSQPKQSSLSQSLPTGTQDQSVNKNIEDLKKLQISKQMFNDLYDIFNCIVMEKDFDALNFAVKEGYCDIKNGNGETVFDCSINECNLELARLIIEFEGGRSYKYNIPNNSIFIRFILKIQNFNADQALIYASREGYYEIVKLLLAIPRIDVNVINDDDETPLILASRGGHQEVVKLLLTVPGINVNAKDYYISTALIYASEQGHYEVVKLLLSVPGIDVNIKNDCNSTALILASLEGHHEVVKLLLAFPGIDINIRDDNNCTSLIFASERGHYEVVKLLLAFPGIDVNITDEYNKTALIWASEEGYHEVVKLLLAVPGIDVNIKDINNNTALMNAILNDHNEVVKILNDFDAV